MSTIAKFIQWLASLFLDLGGTDKISIGMALLSAAIGLLLFVTTSTVTTTMLFGLIVKEESIKTVPYLGLGYFILGLAAIFIAWGVFTTPV